MQVARFYFLFYFLLLLRHLIDGAMEMMRADKVVQAF